jgi:capsular exopolysaccharide synthesis family protein
MNGGETEQDDEGGGAVSLERAVSAVRRRLPIVAVAVGLAAGIGAAIAYFLPTRFEAAAIVQIDPRKKSISNIDSVLADLKADSATVESEVEVIRSRAITLKVIDKLELRSDREFTKPTPTQNLIAMILGRKRDVVLSRNAANPGAKVEDPMTRMMGADNPGADEPKRDEVAAAFAEKLKVNRVRNTLLIEIRFTASDPVKAAKIANSIAEFYLADQLDIKQKASGFAATALEEKLQVLQRKVMFAEKRVAEFKAQHNIFDSEGHLLAEKELARLMEQTVLARNQTAEARAKYEQAQLFATVGARTDDLGSVLESNSIRLLKDQLAAAQRKEAELRTKYGSRHPDILKVSAEVAEAKAQLDEEIRKLVSSLKNVYEVADRREKQLNLDLAKLKDGEVESKAQSIRLGELMREAATEKQLFEALLTRFKETQETQGLHLPDARIVEQADVPLFPAGPKRLQIVLLSIVGGLIAGLAIALVLEFATSGVAVPEDVERSLEIAHLSSIPLVAGPGGANLDPARSVRLVLADPQGAFAESIRNMRREIDVRRRHGASRVVLVASSLPGEGSDIIASNLAHHYALTGNRVLLIDGDLRRAPLTRRLTPHRPPGLADMLTAGAPVEQAILSDAATGLHFLPSSSPDPLPVASPELLSSSRMAAAIAGLRRQYDTIVIEAPPLAPVVDGRILADYADQIVLVMTWRRTPKQLAKRALKSLGLNYQKVAGAVVNEVDPATLDTVSQTGGPSRASTTRSRSAA